MATVTFNGGHSGSLLCVDYTDGLIATGGENGQLTVWDLATKDRLFQYIHDDDADTDCTSVCFSKDGSLLFAAFANKICQFDKRTFLTPVETYQYNDEEINQLNISDKENFIAACDDSGETKILSLQEKKIYKTLRHKHSNICATVAFRPQRQWEMVTGGLDCKLIHWYYAKPKVMNEIDMQELLGENPGNAQILNPPFIHHIDFSADGAHLACALGNGAVKVFDSSRKHLRGLYSLSGHYQGVSQVSFVNDRYLLSGSNDKQMIIWDLEKVSVGAAGANQQAANPQMANGHADAADGHSHNVYDANGDVEEQNDDVPEDCKVYTQQLHNKVNWLKSIIVSDQHHVLVADETTDLTMISTGLL